MRYLSFYSFSLIIALSLAGCGQQHAAEPPQKNVGSNPKPMTETSLPANPPPAPANPAVEPTMPKTPAPGTPEPVMTEPMTADATETTAAPISNIAEIINSVAANAQDAISTSQQLENIKDKKNYLLQQAQNFYNSRQFQAAVDITQYLLAEVDGDFTSAKELLDQAKMKLAMEVKNAVQDVSGIMEKTVKPE